MKPILDKIVFGILLIIITFQLGCTSSKKGSSLDAAYSLLERILPDRYKEFELSVIDSKNGKDVFEIESCNGRVIIRGSNSIAISSGLNWYLKHVASCQITRSMRF